MRSTIKDIQICRVSRRNLHWVLIWPNIDEEVHPKKSYYVKLFVFVLITGLLYAAILMHLFVNLATNSDSLLAEDFAISISNCGTYYIIFTFIYQRINVAQLLKDLSNFQKFGLPPNFKEEQKSLDLLSNVMFIYSLVGTTGYAIVRYIKKSECERRNKDKQLNEICGLVAAVWVPFDTSSSSVYWGTFTFTFISAQLFLKPSLTTISLLYEITRHIILRIKHLNFMIKQCFRTSNYYDCKKKLTTCIQYHQEILELATRLNSCFSKTLFAHVTITSIAFACIEKQFIDEEKIASSLHYFGWFSVLLISCVAGQHLISANESISEAVWTSNWYETDVRLQKDVHFMLMRSQRDLYISAGSFGILGYPLFVAVLKMSYSVLCLLTS